MDSLSADALSRGYPSVPGFLKNGDDYEHLQQTEKES